MEPIDVLTRISVINRDNGKRFTQTDRLDVISSLLWQATTEELTAMVCLISIQRNL